MSNCIVCNNNITSNRNGNKYCSKACKQKAYYQRKTETPKEKSLDLESFTTYKKVLRLGNFSDFGFIEYRFLVSTISGITDISELVDYISYILIEMKQDSIIESEIYYDALENFRKKYLLAK